MDSLEALSVDQLLSKKSRLLSELAQVETELSKRTQESLPDPLDKLSNTDILRYSRQLILPEFGMAAQLSLKRGRVLVVGCGGLGCPAAQFLASCGVSGVIGLVDYDVVEVGNLHRQVLHSEAKIGINKAESVRRAIQELNSSVHVRVFNLALNSSNALDVFKDFDVIIDASDNVATRYLLNDACVLTGKPLVSGSALRFEGQLTVYNYKDGPTYRCLFPTPPLPEYVTNCSDGGVLGVVPGVIGTLQALEAIKIISGVGEVLTGKMLLFDGFMATFKTIRLRERKQTEVDKIQKLVDYEQFCGSSADDKNKTVMLLTKDQDRVSVSTLNTVMRAFSPFVLVDVRSSPELEICSLPGCINIPFCDIGKENAAERIREEVNRKNACAIYVVCRRGNDSQKAVLKLREVLGYSVEVKDVIGGLHAWSKHVDKNFPVY